MTGTRRHTAEGMATTTHMIRRTTLILGLALLAAVLLCASAGATARATSPDDQMRDGIMALRGLIDRQAGTRFFLYPRARRVQPGRLGAWWPDDPWTGAAMLPGTTRGHYRYTVAPDRRRYRLVGYLDGGRTYVVSGGMPRIVMLAYDHRGEEGANLIREYIEEYARAHHGLYPLPADVRADGPVGLEPRRRYWPSDPWDHYVMRQGQSKGSFSYSVSPDRSSYTLRLHRALKHDYVLSGAMASSPWQQLLTNLEDEILRRSGRILSGYVDQWALRHAGALPRVVDVSPTGALGTAHPDWPQDPSSGAPMQPGLVPGAYTYTPGTSGSYTLIVHLHSGDSWDGSTATPPSAPARGSGLPQS